MFWLFCLAGQPLFSQNHSSNNNYTGDWESPSSWNPIWTSPQSYISGGIITINGYITAYDSLSFAGSSTNLIINDTLVIKGDLLLENNNNLIINNQGILIIVGNLTFGNQSDLTSNGYLIITGDLIKSGSVNHGSFTGDDNPVKVFIGGTISLTGLVTNPDYPVLNCVTPATVIYPGSKCSYGDMTDIVNDPIYPFFQTVNCILPTPVITASGPVTLCTGGNVTLTTGPAAGYLWSTGETTSKINVTAAGSYTVKVKNANGCQGAKSLATVVTVNEKPVAVAGPDQELNYTFETRMDAVLQASESGEWSLISGSGHIKDIHSPATPVAELSIGENVFLWKVSNGNCEDSTEVKITVHDLFVPSVITPDGDGKNDYFKIVEEAGKVELIIINRWGNEEFSNNNYLNNWDGRNIKGEELPEDTYFYILRFENGRIKKGSVLIKR